MELVGLRAREAKIKQMVKKLPSDGKLGHDELKAAQEKQRAKELTKRELEILQKGVSNAEYHYLGSAKTMAQIGKGFAEAVADLNKTS